MSVPAFGVIRYLLVFALLYCVLMTIFGLVFIASGIHLSGINILVLIVAATCAALLFIRKHRRVFTLGEFLTIVIGSILVDLALELGSVTMRTGHISINDWPKMCLVFGGHALLLALAYSPWSWIVRSYAKRVATS
jgi:hypothetical protein